jgi:D-serine deaminase-like pyridoxal phosphate-dependent protein
MRKRSLSKCSGASPGSARFERAGLPLGIVSGGSSPTLFRSHEIEGLNEIRPGTYVFNDGDLVAAGHCAWDDCAASVLTTVVSTPREASGRSTAARRRSARIRSLGRTRRCTGASWRLPRRASTS